ncbi:hypothetical protein T484DRAFT_1865306, partial [Baffinella frigidus]
MEKLNHEVLGVAKGGDPLTIVVPTFTSKNLSQSTPLAGFPNTLSLLLQSNVNLAASEHSAITLSILEGASSNRSAVVVAASKNSSDSPGLFCAAGFDVLGNLASWDNETHTLLFTVCPGATLLAATPYLLEWEFSNALAPQSSPAIRIEASGTAVFANAGVDKPGTDLVGVTHGADPLLVIVPTFLSKAIGQSNFLGGEENLITATLMTNVDLATAADGAFISMCCFDSAVAQGAEVTLAVRANATGNVTTFCSSNEPGAVEGTAAWNASSFQVRLYVCSKSGNTFESFVSYVVSFNLTNPTRNQDSPEIFIEESGFFTIANSSMDPPGTVYYGEELGSNPLKVVIPQFTSRAIGQSSPFSGLMNTITVTFASTVQFSGAAGAEITVTGLNAGEQAWPNVSLSGASASSFCVGPELGDVGRSYYSAETGSARLAVCAGSVVAAGQIHVLSFQLRNPPFSQPSSGNSIAGRSFSSNPVQSFAIAETPLVVQGLTVWDVVNATDPLRVLVPTFEFSFMSQSNFYGGEVNTLSLQLRTTVELTCSAEYCHTVTVRGLYGAVMPGTVTLLGDENMTSRFCGDESGTASSTGVWDQATSELTMYICRGTSVRAYENIHFAFNITNPIVEQPSPLIILAGTGPVPLTSVSVENPGVTFLGVPNGTDPLNIVAPEFTVKDVGQTMPFSGLANSIFLTLQ